MGPRSDISVFFALLYKCFSLLVFITIGLHLCEQYHHDDTSTGFKSSANYNLYSNNDWHYSSNLEATISMREEQF